MGFLYRNPFFGSLWSNPYHGMKSHRWLNLELTGPCKSTVEINSWINSCFLVSPNKKVGLVAYFITQLARTIPLIYQVSPCQLGDCMLPIPPFFWESGNSIDWNLKIPNPPTDQVIRKIRVDVPVFSVWIRMGRIANMCSNCNSTFPDIAQKMLVVFLRTFPDT